MSRFMILRTHIGEEIKLLPMDVVLLKELCPTLAPLLDQLLQNETVTLATERQAAVLGVLNGLDTTKLSREPYLRSATKPGIDRLSTYGLVAMLRNALTRS